MGRNFNKDCPPCLTAFQGSGWRLPGGSLLGFTCLKPIVCLKHITCVHPLHVLIHHVCSSQVGNSQQDFLHFAAKSLQSCLTLCDPMDCSLPGSSVHGIFQTVKPVPIMSQNIVPANDWQRAPSCGQTNGDYIAQTNGDHSVIFEITSKY